MGIGADIGPTAVDKSYELHTAPLVSKFSDLSPAYITGFELDAMLGMPKSAVFSVCVS